MLLAGKSVALISDAGTPLISDPGFPLLQAAQAQGVRVVPIPGCCAAIAALSASGLPVERFVFEGFPPARSAGRLRKFESLAGETRTIIFYESSHRVTASLSDMIQVFGPGRQAALAREITKQFETIVNAELSRLLEFVTGDANQQKGEFVIMLHGAEEKKGNDLLIILGPLMNALSLKQAVELTVEITGCPRNEVYTEALKLKN
jgi:16S rRNA (cytidine1402-2'-O)-methyltransferase